MRRLSVLLFGLMACQAGVGPDPEQVRAAIDDANQTLERLYAAGQVDSASAFFAEDAWQMPPNAPPLVGRAAFVGFWSQAVGWGRWHFDFEAQDVVVADAIAVERGAYTLTFEAGPESPMPTFEDRGNYLVLWRLEADGQWRILWDAPVSELPPAADAE